MSSSVPMYFDFKGSRHPATQGYPVWFHPGQAAWVQIGPTSRNRFLGGLATIGFGKRVDLRPPVRLSDVLAVPDDGDGNVGSAAGKRRGVRLAERAVHLLMDHGREIVPRRRWQVEIGRGYLGASLLGCLLEREIDLVLHGLVDP